MTTQYFGTSWKEFVGRLVRQQKGKGVKNE